MEVEHGTFTPLIFTTTGVMGHECSIFHKSLAEKLSIKRDERYDDVMRYIRIKFSFLALKATLLCLRGSRTIKKAADIDSDFGLALQELGVWRIRGWGNFVHIILIIFEVIFITLLAVNHFRCWIIPFLSRPWVILQGYSESSWLEVWVNLPKVLQQTLETDTWEGYIEREKHVDFSFALYIWTLSLHSVYFRCQTQFMLSQR